MARSNYHRHAGVAARSVPSRSCSDTLNKLDFVFFFSGDNEILTYFYGPVGVLLIMNIVLFGMTTWELTCGLWKREMVKTTSERYVKVQPVQRDFRKISIIKVFEEIEINYLCLKLQF